MDMVVLTRQSLKDWLAEFSQMQIKCVFLVDPDTLLHTGHSHSKTARSKEMQEEAKQSSIFFACFSF